MYTYISPFSLFSWDDDDEDDSDDHTFFLQRRNNTKGLHTHIKSIKQHCVI